MLSEEKKSAREIFVGRIVVVIVFVPFFWVHLWGVGQQNENKKISRFSSEKRHFAAFSSHLCTKIKCIVVVIPGTILIIAHVPFIHLARSFNQKVLATLTFALSGWQWKVELFFLAWICMWKEKKNINFLGVKVYVKFSQNFVRTLQLMYYEGYLLKVRSICKWF